MLRPVNIKPNGSVWLQQESVDSGVWGGTGIYHWWGKPAIADPLQYRYMVNGNPDTPNATLIDNHADLLTSGGIDFISIDLSNGTQTLIVNGARALCKRFEQRKLAGLPTPQVVFFVNKESTAQVVYDTFYTDDYLDSIFFRYAGKPLILVHEVDSAIPTNGVFANFTARRTWGLHNAQNAGTEWSFKDNTTTTLPSFKTSGWPEQRGVAAATQRSYMTVTNDGRKGRNNGAYFNAQWKDVATDSPTFVFMTAWNEWGSENQFKPDNGLPNPTLTDTFLTEYSADLEPMQGGHGAQYYDMMKTKVAQYKRNAPNVVMRDSSSGVWNFKYYYGAKQLADSNYSFAFSWLSGTKYQSFTGDFNGDGLTDIGLRDTTSGTWSFAPRIAGTQTFDIANARTFSWVTGANYQPIVADFNGDGKTDIGMRDSNNGIWYFRPASAAYTFPTQYSFSWTTGAQFQAFAADFNNDDKIDLGLRNASSGVIAFATQGASNTFSIQGATFNWVTGTNYQALAGDFDRDGFGDVALRDSNTGRVSLTNGNGSFSGFSNDDNLLFTPGTDLTASNLADDAAPLPPTISIADVSVVEGSNGTSNAVFTVSLNGFSDQSVTLNFVTGNGTATAPADYTATNGTLIFEPGDTTKTITVPVISDILDETDETFTVSLSAIINATGARIQATGTITDDDTAYVWNGGNGNWTDTSKWTPTGYPRAAGDTAAFNTGTGIVTIPATPADAMTGKITLAANSGDYTIDASGGASLTLGDAIAFDVGAGRILNLKTSLAGGATVTKSSGGTLLLAGANSFNSSAIINFETGNADSGAIRLANNGALGGVVTINELTTNTGKSRVELLGDIALGTGVTINTGGRSLQTGSGAALVNLSGNNTWSGNINIINTGGGYGLRSNAGVLTLSGTISTTLNNVLRIYDVGGSGDVAVSGIIQNSAINAANLIAVTKSGTGKLTLSGQNTYTGATTLSDGILALGATNTIADASDLALGGGSFNPGGKNDNLGVLTTTAAAKLDFENGPGMIKWSSAGTLTGKISILGYKGKFSGGGARIFIGATQNLTSPQLSQLAFVNPDGLTATLAARQLPNGEVVPAYPLATSGALISEFRFRGPTSDDEYVEIVNMLATPLNISGWKLQTNRALGSAAANIVTTTVPQDTIIPARGHFLFTGAGYSLSSYGLSNLSLGADVADDSGVALQNASSQVQDAVGFASSNASMREDGPLASAPTANGQHAFMRAFNGQSPRDNGNSSSDFVFLTTNGANVAGNAGNITARLGSPNPEGLASPVNINAQIGVRVLDANFGPNAAPNRIRTGSGNGGSLLFRRIIKNNTGQPLNRIRLLVTDITGQVSPAVAGQADVRLTSYPNENVTLAGQATPVTVFGTTLEAPSIAPTGNGPTTLAGGGLGASVNYDIVLSTPLQPGEERAYGFNVQVAKTGSFFVNLNILN